jgi:thiamine-monophosphate kinase
VTPDAQHTTPLGRGAEFDVIRTMLRRWGHRAVGIGDDAAVLEVPRGDKLVVSVDTAIEGQHFRREWLTLEEIGYRAATAALSDLAAMAARPLGILVALELPDSARAEVTKIADGMADAVDAVGTKILGGNVAAGEALSLTTTVLGTAFSPLTRTGVAPGDLLYVTGQLGAPGAALMEWASGRTPWSEARERFARPSARIREALWLADRGARAAIDLSDGLAADLEQLALASNVGLDVDLALVPLAPRLEDALEAAASGEEYELVVAARSPFRTEEFEKRFGVPLTCIGRATFADQGLQFRLGDKRVAKPPGYDHFSQ